VNTSTTQPKDTTMTSKFWLQTQAPAGNWTDNLGSDDQQACVSHGEYLAKQGDAVRVVERTDTVVWAPKAKIAKATKVANLTDNEARALRTIVASEYQDGDNPVGHDVWTQYVNPFANKKTQGGVYASLSQKGLIKIGGDYDMGTGKGKMGTVCITQSGFDALRAHDRK
jgi:hypothetical protein